MAQRVFGPIRGAGVQLTELAGEKPIEPGALGFAAYAGILEKGDPGELIQVLSKIALGNKTGGLISDSTLPDACRQYFDNAAGAGGLLLVRVTDGNEQAANGYKDFARTARIANLYSRRTSLTQFGFVDAKNGGRWGGQESNYTDEFSISGDLTETTLTTGLSKFSTDEWQGGFIELNAVANKRYPITGNTAAGVITVESDQTMAADLAASGSPTDFRYYLVLDRDEDKAVSIELRDGEELPNTEFGLFVFENGDLVKEYPDLSIDPTNKRFWVNLINDDTGNEWITVTDTFTGQRTADVRPASFYGEIASVTDTVMNIVLTDFTINSPGGGDPTFALGTTNDTMLRQKITITMTSATVGTAVSDRFGLLGTVTLGVLFDPPAAAGGAVANKWSPPFTITAGGSPLAATDTLVINYKPFVPGELVDELLFPDKVNSPLTRFRIASNDHDTVTVADGSAMTTASGGPADVADEWMIEAPFHLVDGRDGVADLIDSDFIAQAYDVDLSPFNRIFGRNLGLVKFATPGNTSVAVQKAGKAYAEAKNYQYRYEIPANIVNEEGADTFVNTTLGRSDYAVVSFPSFGSIADPEGEQGKLKLVPLTGAIHGREARIANDFLGHHKAQAGIEATLPQVLEIPTGETILNEEVLNPRGINVIKKIQGNFVLWGDRTLHLDPTWRFKHEREQMSFYEHVLQESFDFIIFGLNNASSRNQVKTSLISFFLPEFIKGALDTDFTFTEAAQIKIDTENNTPATKAAGDMIVEIKLRLVGVVERLRIFISKAGIFEAVGGA